VIASNVGGLSEALDFGEAGLLTGNDPREIAAAMRRLREDSKATGGDANHDFADGDEDGGHNRVACHRAFLGAHGIGRVKGRSPGHDEIIASEAGLRQENRPRSGVLRETASMLGCLVGLYNFLRYQSWRNLVCVRVGCCVYFWER